MRFAAKGVKIYVYGIGSAEGAPVPEPGGGGFMKDASGGMVMVDEFDKMEPGASRSAHVGMAASNIYVFFTKVLPVAIKKYGGIDGEALRKAALDVDLPDGGTMLGFGVKFGNAFWSAVRALAVAMARARARSSSSARTSVTCAMGAWAMPSAKARSEASARSAQRPSPVRCASSIALRTAWASVDVAVEAMRRGAADYIPKPFTPEQIRRVIDKALRARALERRLRGRYQRAPACDVFPQGWRID